MTKLQLSFVRAAGVLAKGRMFDMPGVHSRVKFYHLVCILIDDDLRNN